MIWVMISLWGQLCSESDHKYIFAVGYMASFETNIKDRPGGYINWLWSSKATEAPKNLNKYTVITS